MIQSPTLVISKNKFKVEQSSNVFSDSSRIQNTVGCTFYYKNRNNNKLMKSYEQSFIDSAELTAIREIINSCLTLNKT